MARRKGSEWWKKHHQDFYGSMRVWKMGPEAACLYDFMLGWQWEEGAVPDDPEFVRNRWPWHKGARGKKRFEKLWNLVRPCFDVTPTGLQNVTQANKIEQKLRSNSVWSGRQARARAVFRRDKKNCHAVEERREEERRGDETTPPIPPKGGERAPAREAPRGPGITISDFWCEHFLATRGKPYAWQGGKDGRHLADVRKWSNDDVAEVKKRIRRFLADPFWKSKADFAKFASQWNALATSPKETDPFREVARDLGFDPPQEDDDDPREPEMMEP